KELEKQRMCPMDLARRLKQHEQKIYYYVRKLEDAGLIRVAEKEKRVGALAKVYELTSQAVTFKFSESPTIKKLTTRVTELSFLHPFIEDGKFNSIVIIGSPDPHGKYKASASDGYCAINLALFFGQFLKRLPVPFYKLDTQVKENDLKKNLILIGGPKANMIAEKINKQLPIYFDYSEDFLDWSIVSNLSKKVYRDKRVGLIVRIKSPFKDGKEILVFAGKGFRGSRAAVLGFIRYIDVVQNGNDFDKTRIAKVVKGVDVDSDGIIDDVEFLE
ncbi:MAG TPA: ArsR family transcriptional regulator, partial [Candidatus Aenigmarchaeota archaeon]|nr:ArsR family transcriptional regulator [Candidatus Aenigmarchaeota archaeon]